MNIKKLIHEIKALKSKSVPVKYIFYYLSISLIPSTVLVLIIKIKNIFTNSNVIGKDFNKQMNISKEIDELIKNNQRIKTVHDKHYSNVNSVLIQFEMESVDWMSAPFSVEHRHPFYDKRLVEFCLAIPAEQKVSNGWDRYIMRRALNNIIPNEIQWRKNKGNLSFNFNKSLLREEDELKKIINTNNSQFKKYIDKRKLRKIYNQFKSGKMTVSMYIWNAILIYRWIERDKLN